MRSLYEAGARFNITVFLGIFHCKDKTVQDDVIKWKHFSALLAICEGNPPVTSGFPSQRPVTRSFDVFFDLPEKKTIAQTIGTPVIWEAVALIMTSM